MESVHLAKHKKWDGIRQYLCEIAAKVKTILWGESSALGLLIHEKCSDLRKSQLLYIFFKSEIY